MAQIDLETGKNTNFIRFDTGVLYMDPGCGNLGSPAVITAERHPGSFDMVRRSDATWLANIFVNDKSNKPWILLPQGKGIHLFIPEERDWWPNKAMVKWFLGDMLERSQYLKIIQYD